MKKTTIFLFLTLVLLVPIVMAGGGDYMDYLSKPYADTLYCQVGGDCVMGNITVSAINLFNGSINFINVTIVNYNVTGELNIDGNISADYYCDNDGNCYSIAELKLDTNASTACNDDYYLDGNGLCIHFNNTVLALTSSTTYNASSIVLGQGIHDGGDINSIQNTEDSDTYNISEEGGVNSLQVNITFCDIEDIDFIAIAYWYDADGHTLPVGLYDWYANEFEFEYGSLVSTPTYHWFQASVLDAGSHINDSGCAILQIDHEGTGISSHDLILDAVFLQEGSQLSTVNSLFQLDGRDDPTALEWAWDKNGSKTATGDWDLGGYDLTNSGNVGIGIATPTSELHVIGTANISIVETNKISPSSGLEVTIGDATTTLKIQKIAVNIGSNLQINSHTNFGAKNLFNLGVVQLSDGTSALPSLAFQSNLTTGIHRSGVDSLGISARGVKRIDVTPTYTDFITPIYTNTIKDREEEYTYSFGDGFQVAGDFSAQGVSPIRVIDTTFGELIGMGSKGWMVFNNHATGDSDAFTINSIGLSGDNVLKVQGNSVDFLRLNNSGSLYVLGSVDADFYTEHSTAIELPQDKNALDYFTTTWEDRSYINEKGELTYNHTNKDDMDLLLVKEDIIECDIENYINKKGEEAERKVNCSVVEQIEKKSLSALAELQRDATYELIQENQAKDIIIQNICIEDNLKYSKYDWCDEI